MHDRTPPAPPYITTHHTEVTVDTDTEHDPECDDPECPDCHPEYYEDEDWRAAYVWTPL